jgi:hypothetical protein
MHSLESTESPNLNGANQPSSVSGHCLEERKEDEKSVVQGFAEPINVQTALKVRRDSHCIPSQYVRTEL